MRRVQQRLSCSVAMNDKSALLNQLRIDRATETERSGRARPGWALVVVAVFVMSSGAAAWFWHAAAAIPVHAVAALPVGPAAVPGAGSVLDASGYVVARRLATVSSKITGRMVELDIEEGEHVKAGQVIARLDDTNSRAAFDQAHAELEFAKAGLAQTEVNLANAQRDYDRQLSLVPQHFVSQAAVDTARTTLEALRAQLATQRSNIGVAASGVAIAQRNLDDTVVHAPFSGVVTVKAAQPGEIVSPISAGGGFTRTGIGTIVDMDSLEIEVDVNENFINRVESGQSVDAKLNAYPDWHIPAHVIAIIPTADRSKGTVTVRIGLDRKDPRILPEMGVRVAFLAAAPAAAEVAPSGVRIPRRAVDASGSTGVVFVLHQTRIERRAVRLGAADGDGVIVLAGLAAGERVAVGDFKELKNGAAVRVED
jgi:RND family efflux transporter MFP subunit